MAATYQEINEIRRKRLVDEHGARQRYYANHKCGRCGETPSIHCDEHTKTGPLCTPCRAKVKEK